MPARRKTRLILLDAHAILHRAYHALPDFTAPNGEPTGALYGVVTMVLKISEELSPDHIVACFDLPKPTYRHDAYKAYKSGRTKTDESLVAQITRSRDIFAALNIPIYEHEGFEADDILGTIAHQVANDAELEVIIASGDMDTLQLVEKKRVQVYTLKKGLNDTILYDEAAVKARFGFGPSLIPDYKGLRGDPSDNIPGVAGIGDKGATELIMAFGTLEKIYAKLEKNEDTLLAAGSKPRTIKLLKEQKEEALFSKMLATIRLDAPVVFSLPTTPWREGIDSEKVLTLFSELGFRTLSVRMRELLEMNQEISIDQTAAKVSDADVKRTAVLLWLLESDRTHASYEEIIDYGRTFLSTSDFGEITNLLIEKLKAEELYEVFQTIEAPLLPVIERINSTGVLFDVAYLSKLSTKLHKELRTLEKDVYAAAGVEFNINSPKQLGDILFDTLGLKPKNQKKTSTGQKSTKESELEKMKDDHPIIASILRYRELQKLTSTYIDNLPKLVDDDGRLRTTFLQTGTTTGRISSKDPNLQNIPIRTEEGRAIRKAFIAPAGFSLVAIDYSQIELRIAAILSQDQGLLEIFRKGEDVHAGVAARVFNVAEDEVTSEMRRKAKVINFGILYGMGVNALRGNLGEDTTRQEAQEFLDAYFNTFTRLAEYLEETKAFALTHGYTKTVFGRRRRFPGITSSAPFIRAAAERMAINAPIQGTEGDILRLAMIEIDAYIQKTHQDGEVKMLLQVHDELVFEVKDSLLTEVIPTLVSLMENVWGETSGVPISVEVEVGKNWQDLTKWQS